MAKRVCFLLNNEFIYDNRVKREAESLTKAGYDVTLFAKKDMEKRVPDSEEQHGVHIRRIFPRLLPYYDPLTLYHLQMFIKIILKYRQFDIIHAHDANMLRLGWMLARYYKAKLVYDSHELWESVFKCYRETLIEHSQDPEKVNYERRKKLFWCRLTKNTKLDISLRQRRFDYPKLIQNLDKMARMENGLLPKCDAVISVNESLCRLLQDQAQGKISQCVSLRNMPYSVDLPSSEKLHLFHQTFSLPLETRVVLYQGVLADSRGVPHMLEAMTHLHDAGIVLVLMGQCNPQYKAELLEQIQRSPVLSRNVIYKDPVFTPDFPLWTASADLGIIPIPATLEDRVTYYYTLPNKLFEYIQAGIPVATSHLPEVEQIVDTYGIGFTLNPKDPQEIAEKLRGYVEDSARQERYRQNLRQAKADLCWENEEQVLLNLYRRLEGKPAFPDPVDAAASKITVSV